MKKLFFSSLLFSSTACAYLWDDLNHCIKLYNKYKLPKPVRLKWKSNCCVVDSCANLVVWWWNLGGENVWIFNALISFFENPIQIKFLKLISRYYYDYGNNIRQISHNYWGFSTTYIKSVASSTCNVQLSKPTQVFLTMQQNINGILSHTHVQQICFSLKCETHLPTTTNLNEPVKSKVERSSHTLSSPAQLL